MTTPTEPLAFVFDVAPTTSGAASAASSSPSPNATVVEAWNTILFDKFVRYRDLLTAGLGRHGRALFERHAPGRGERVVDVGMGFGETSTMLAEAVGPEGHVTGIDCAARFVQTAQAMARAEGTKNVKFLRADVELDHLHGPYDAAYSRFGTQFFSHPVAAFRNIHASLKPGGRLAFSVWRKREDNPCFHIAQKIADEFVGEVDRTGAVTCGPGPFAQASADVVTDQLKAAGFGEIVLERFDAPMCIGRDLDQALDFARDLGPAGETIRLAGARLGDGVEKLNDAMRAAFEPHLKDDGVWLESSTWLISART